MTFQQKISIMPYNHWLFYEKENKLLFIVAVIIIVITFVWLKIIYPFPNFMPPDSGSYIEAAYNNDFINYWPIGYSKFLQLVNRITNSHLILVIIQFLLIVGSLLYFLFTVRYLLSPNKLLFRFLFIISVCNPLLPHIANFISSDCLFTSLSLIWLTQLFWIVYHPNKKLLLLHSIILLFAFTVRYSSLYYPFISIAVIAFSTLKKKQKLPGIISIVFLLLAFIGTTQSEYKIKTGKVQYSAFAGWQLAANALYGYAYSTPVNSKDVPLRFRGLHSVVNHHMDSIRNNPWRPDKDIGIYYLWDTKSPLRAYMKYRFVNEPNMSTFSKWASIAPVYASYGKYLIRKHPSKFIKHFVLPNLARYYSPPTYFMGNYNMGNPSVEPIIATWFGWESDQLPTRNNQRQIEIMSIFPTIVSIVNSLFLLFGIMVLLNSNAKNYSKASIKIFFLLMMIWLSNIIFSVFSAPIELRYELFLFIFIIPFTGLYLDALIYSLRSASPSQLQSPQLVKHQNSQFAKY